MVKLSLRLLLLGIFTCPVALFADVDLTKSAPGLWASLDRDSAGVGGIITLTLRYRLPDGAQLPQGPVIKGLEDLTVLDRQMGPDRIMIRLLIDRLGSWKTGHFSLTYLDKEGKTQELTADPLMLTVLSNLGEKPEEADLKPIQGIIPTRSLWGRYLPWAAGLLCILIVLFFLVRFYLKYRKNKLAISDRAPAHITARKEIEELAASDLFENGNFKEFYFRFSEILRHYLESLRGFPAAEFTTQEISLYIDNDQDRGLLALLRQADLVKFADTIPTPAKNEDEMKTALSYIDETGRVLETSQTADDRGTS